MNDDEIIISDNDNNEVGIQQAQKFIHLVESGVEPKQAAHDAGSTLKRLTRDPEVMAAIENLKQYAFGKPEIERWLVKTQMMKDMLMSEAPRDRATAAKIVIMDPELGFTQDQPSVVINISEDVAKLDPGPMEWGEEK